MSDEREDEREVVDVRFLRRRLEEAQEDLRRSQLGNGEGGSYMPDMSERLGRLEGEISGLKHGQNMTLGGLGLIVALVTIVVGAVVGFGVYELQRIDQLGDRIGSLNDRVNELPGKISSDLRDLTKTLADVIIATKQTQTPTPPAPPSPQPNLPSPQNNPPNPPAR
jgi:hypothetical protein